MLSSTGSDQTNYNTTSTNSTNNTQNRVSSSSNSSWSSSSPSPFSHLSSLQTATTTTSPRTMEEVWKDINLASLPDSTTTPNRPPHSLLHINLSNGTHRHQNFRNMTLQDFLARPFGHNDPPPPRLVVSAAAATTGTSTLNSPASPLPPAPATLLNLNNSGSELQVFYVSDPLRPPTSEFQLDHHHHHQLHHLHHQSNPNNICSSISNSFSGNPFEGLPSPPSGGLPSFGKRSFPESDHGNSGDQRHKRMIKNRESAARSRARKQAYTNELELEVAHLMEENAKLKRQQLSFAAASQQPKRNNIHRSSTAPF